MTTTDTIPDRASPGPPRGRAGRAGFLEEAAADPRLWRVGALLGLAELLCVAQLWHMEADRRLARGGEALCWPFWPGCGAWRVLDRGPLTALLVLLGVLSTAVSAAFLRRSRLALPLLGLTMLLVLGVEVQDFRLRLNQFYMLAIVVTAFVALPDRSRVLRYLVVAFYFWAGLLKLNREWLTGAALYRPVPGLDGPVLRLGCAWAVALELVMVFGLFSRRRAVFAATMVQLGLFTAASAFVVGLFYPLLMAVLVTAAALLRREGEPAFVPWRERPSTMAAIGLFSALQIWPRLLPGDPAITGEGRIFALHMFDARVVCESTVTVRDGERVVQVVDARPGLPSRTACDPASLYARGRSLCARLGPGLSVDLHLASRRSSEPSLRPVVDLADFCRDMPVYHLLRHNEWIRTE